MHRRRSSAPGVREGLAEGCTMLAVTRSGPACELVYELWFPPADPFSPLTFSFFPFPFFHLELFI